MKGTGVYPADWKQIAREVKESAGWACIRCGHPHDPAGGYTLTTHHLSMDKSDCQWFNIPLAMVDLRSEQERGQMDLFDNECTGSCGL